MGCGLTASLASGPQERVQRHTVGQIVDSTPGLPTLDVPVPLMVEQLVNVLQFFDALSLLLPEVIDVPKIIIECIPPRTSVREPQLAEQLVEVPRSITSSSRTLTSQFRRVVGDTQIFKVSFVDRVQQVSSRSFIFPVEVFKVFAQDKIHLHHPHLLTLQLVFMGKWTRPGEEGFFALFPVPKKSAKVTRRSSARVLRRVPPGLRTSLTTATSFAKMRRRSG